MFAMTLHQQEFIITLLAILGGIIVLIGLQMEHGAVKDWYRSQSDYRRQKSKGNWGHRLVMAGILIETAIGGYFAYQEVAEMWNMNPLNQPITDMTATLIFGATTTNNIVGGDDKIPTRATLELLSVTNANPFPNSFGVLTSYNYIRLGSTNSQRYSLKFTKNDFSAATSLETLLQKPADKIVELTPATFISNINVLRIGVTMLSTNAEIVDGGVELILNGNTRVEYVIIPQKNYPGRAGRNYFASTIDSSYNLFTLIATNPASRIYTHIR